MPFDLPSRITYRPLRIIVGVIVSSIILILSPFLSFAVLCYDYLWSDTGKLGRIFLLYFRAWCMYIGLIWIGVFTKSDWFGELPSDKSPDKA